VAHGWAPLTVSLPDLAQNILLYVPFGTLAALSVAGPPARRAAVALAVCTAILVSLAVESVQLHMADRTASLVDVMAAAAGAAIGALAANAAARNASRAATAAPLLRGRSGSLLMALVLAATAIAWWPFDVTLDVSTVAARVRGMRDAMWMDTTPPGLLTLKAALFAAIAYLVCSPRPERQRGAVPIAVVAMIGYAIAVDVGQGLMGSRPAGLATLCWQLTGIAGGVAIAAISRPAP